MFFTGANAEALAGAIDLELISTPSTYVQGQFIVEKDFRLSSAEALTLDRAFVGAASGTTWTTDLGLSSDGASGSPLLADTVSFHGVYPGTPGSKASPIGYVIRQDLAPTLVATTSDTSYQMSAPDPAFEVSWGAWNGEASAVKTQASPSNPGSTGSIPNMFYWMTFQPAPDTAIAGRTGSVTFANPIAILGGGNNGDINPGSFSFSALINFDTGTLSSGSMSFADPGGTWDASFSGSLNGATFSMVSPLVHYNSDSGNPATATINAVLTGPNAEGLAGNFDFDYLSGTADTAGVFLVNCAGDGSC